jgi:hypothetical protein
LENRAGRKEAQLIHQVLFEQFVGSFSAPPRELILDFDCTDDRVHGMQVGRAFHRYYYDYCFLPLHVFCGEQLLVSYPRPGVGRGPGGASPAVCGKLGRKSGDGFEDILGAGVEIETPGLESLVG